MYTNMREKRNFNLNLAGIETEWHSLISEARTKFLKLKQKIK